MKINLKFNQSLDVTNLVSDILKRTIEFYKIETNQEEIDKLISLIEDDIKSMKVTN